MVSPERERTAALHIQESHGVGKRGACAAIRQPRSTQRHGGQRRDKDAVLAAQLRRISRSDRDPATGWRRCR